MKIATNERAFGEHFYHDIINYISQYILPKEVFDNKQLSRWAEENGYILRNELMYEDEGSVRFTNGKWYKLKMCAKCDEVFWER